MQSEMGTVTRVVSEQTVEVDGVPRHVKDLRKRRVYGDGGQQPPTVMKRQATQNEGEEDWPNWDDVSDATIDGCGVGPDV